MSSPAHAASPTPAHAPHSTDVGRWVVVSLPSHTVQVKQDGNVVKEIHHFATGRLGHLTPIVDHVPIDPHMRYKMHHSGTYNKAPMPWSLFFIDGCAFHEGNPDVESHGCVHLTATDAEWLFDWVGSYAVNVQIRGPQCSGPHPGLGPQHPMPLAAQ